LVDARVAEQRDETTVYTTCGTLHTYTHGASSNTNPLSASHDEIAHSYIVLIHLLAMPNYQLHRASVKGAMPLLSGGR